MKYNKLSLLSYIAALSMILLGAGGGIVGAYSVPESTGCFTVGFLLMIYADIHGAVGEK